jgi:hypothetical protein
MLTIMTVLFFFPLVHRRRPGGCTDHTGLCTVLAFNRAGLLLISSGQVPEIAAHPYSGSFSTSDATNGQSPIPPLPDIPSCLTGPVVLNSSNVLFYSSDVLFYFGYR